MKAKITVVIEYEYEIQPEYYESDVFEDMLQADIDSPDLIDYAIECGNVSSVSGKLIHE